MVQRISDTWQYVSTVAEMSILDTCEVELEMLAKGIDDVSSAYMVMKMRSIEMTYDSKS